MSYQAASELQQAIYQVLTGYAPLTALVGANIFDADPEPEPGAGPLLYVLIGEEQARDRSSQTHRGAEFRPVISVHSSEAGYASAKQAAAEICNTLEASEPTISAGSVIYFRFSRARARRMRNSEQRRIELTFRTLIDLN